MRSLGALLVLVSLLSAGCAATPVPRERSPRDLRDLQTHYCETGDVPRVMTALLTVLQDERFTLNPANVERGLVTATRAVEMEAQDAAAGTSAGLGRRQARGRTRARLECAGTVADFSGHQTRVRVACPQTVLDPQGAVLDVRPIEDPEYYQRVFSKMEKGIFLQGDERCGARPGN